MPPAFKKSVRFSGNKGQSWVNIHCWSLREISGSTELQGCPEADPSPQHPALLTPVSQWVLLGWWLVACEEQQLRSFVSFLSSSFYSPLQHPISYFYKMGLNLCVSLRGREKKLESVQSDLAFFLYKMFWGHV